MKFWQSGDKSSGMGGHFCWLTRSTSSDSDLQLGLGNKIRYHGCCPVAISMITQPKLQMSMRRPCFFLKSSSGAIQKKDLGRIHRALASIPFHGVAELGVGVVGKLAPTRCSEIRQLDVALLVGEYVRSFEVAMHDLLAMEIDEAIKDLDGEFADEWFLELAELAESVCDAPGYGRDNTEPYRPCTQDRC